MSRHGYVEDEDEPGQFARWRGVVASAARGKRGQAFFRALLAALDAMPEKRLIEGELEGEDGAHCALGVLGAARGHDLGEVDTTDWTALGEMFNIAEQLAQEVMYTNDEAGDFQWDQALRRRRRTCTPEERWAEVRGWVAYQIRCTPDELLPMTETTKETT